MADRGRSTFGYLETAGLELRPDPDDRAGRHRRARRRARPNHLCRGRYRQGPAGGAVQDVAAGRCRLLPGFAAGARRIAETVGVPAVAADLRPGWFENRLIYSWSG